MKRVTHIAGVTFSNDPADGGQSRQELLSELFQYGPELVNLERTIYHNPETNEDENAIKVRSTINHKIIGWIPRTHIEALWNTRQMLLSIGYLVWNFSRS